MIFYMSFLKHRLEKTHNLITEATAKEWGTVVDFADANTTA